jgi:polysaccharide deacetylase 2 family uncharacterized protein YibQ
MNRRLVLFVALVIITASIFAVCRFRAGEKAEDVPLPEEAREKEAGSPEKEPAVIALVLDDFGYTKKNLEKVKDIGVPLTVAVLPGTPYCGTVCSFAEENGLEVILHLPMEPEKETEHLEKDTIRTDMDDATVKEIIADAFRTVPAADGVSNHMGSKATGDRRLMASVFADLKKRDMFFLDSFTARRSICRELAEETGIPYVRRDVFIDNDLDAAYIRKQLEKLQHLALEKGKAVGIGHDRGITVEVLQETVPGMRENGIKFVTLSEMVEGQKSGR